MRSHETRGGWPAAAVAAAGLLTFLALAGGATAGGTAPGTTPPAPAPTPAPPAPAPPPDGAAAAAAEPAAAPAGEALPRIVRVVCTDHVCGGCDGKCRRDSGHVAVDKKGHCACTPNEGSDLDRATREAYTRKPPQ